MNIRQFLRDHGASFRVIMHRPTYEANELAQAVAVSGEEVAKCVLLRADDDYLLTVVPATCYIDLDMVKDVTGAERVELATEMEIAAKFPDCELGALPPFGSAYGVATLVDESLTVDDEILFEGNTCDEAIRMKFAQFVELERPQISQFAYRKSV